MKFVSRWIMVEKGRLFSRDSDNAEILKEYSKIELTETSFAFLRILIRSRYASAAASYLNKNNTSKVDSII